MAVRLPKSVYIHLMKTGGWSIRYALGRMKLNRGEIGREHDPACLLGFPLGSRPFTFVFVRHPLTWYRSYWAYRMEEGWKVRPHQPITGWQTFGSVLDHECRANDFERWIRNVLAYVPEGFLSRVYRIYTDGVDFVGKVESLGPNFFQALSLAGEQFSPRQVQELPRRNVTNPKFIAAATLPKGLAEQVLKAEAYVAERWGYDSIPASVVRAEAGKRGSPGSEVTRRQRMLDRIVTKRIKGFTFQKECRHFLKELGRRSNGRITRLALAARTRKERAAISKLTTGAYLYHRLGYDCRPMTFRVDGTVGEGVAGMEVYWDVVERDGKLHLEIRSPRDLTCRLQLQSTGVWRGRWRRFERMQIELSRLNSRLTRLRASNGERTLNRH